MSVLQHLGPWNRGTRRAAVILGGLLLTLTLSPRAHAVTAVSIDGHPNPVSLVEGETITIRCDTAKPGAAVQFTLARDLTGTAKFDATAPVADAIAVVDGGGGDVDPAPAKIAAPYRVGVSVPAGPYVLDLADRSDGSSVDLPLTIVPKPQPQAISGRAAVISATNPTGTPPPDAIIWAYSDPQTPVASAHIQADGSYSLPVPPGTHIVFAEWFGNLRSQRQLVSVAAAQAKSGVDLPLLQGQEVSGTLRDDASKPLANAPVQAMPTGGTAGGMASPPRPSPMAPTCSCCPAAPTT
jgi:hypothetical protein